MLVGGVMLTPIWMVRQRNFARGQSMKRCCIVSSWSRKEQCALPTHRCFTRLSLVRITRLWTNHLKILIRKGTFTFQLCFDLVIGPELMRSKYIDLTENTPLTVNFQWKESGWSESWTSINLCTKCSQEFHRSPTKDLLNWMFNVTDYNTVTM